MSEHPAQEPETSSEPKKPPRSYYLLPNMLTTFSMFLGFLAMVWAANSRFEAAGIAILVSALMDGLDGKVARLTNTASEFGIQYDSLADLVAFGIAPSFLLWKWSLFHLGRAGIAAAFIFCACGALRLARFNVGVSTQSKRFFIGLPIPAGGCTAVALVFFAKIFQSGTEGAIPYFTAIVAVCTGLLMVSRVRYFAFKEFDFFTAHPVRSMIGFLFILALGFSYPRFFGFFYCALYILWGIVFTLLVLRRCRSIQSPQNDKESGSM